MGIKVSQAGSSLACWWRHMVVLCACVPVSSSDTSHGSGTHLMTSLKLVASLQITSPSTVPGWGAGLQPENTWGTVQLVGGGTGQHSQRREGGVSAPLLDAGPETRVWVPWLLEGGSQECVAAGPQHSGVAAAWHQQGLGSVSSTKKKKEGKEVEVTGQGGAQQGHGFHQSRHQPGPRGLRTVVGT